MRPAGCSPGTHLACPGKALQDLAPLTYLTAQGGCVETVEVALLAPLDVLRQAASGTLARGNHAASSHVAQPALPMGALQLKAHILRFGPCCMLVVRCSHSPPAIELPARKWAALLYANAFVAAQSPRNLLPYHGP